MLYGAVLRAPVGGRRPRAGSTRRKARAVGGVVQDRPDALRRRRGSPKRRGRRLTASARSAGAMSHGDKTGAAWGFDSDKGLADFTAAARDLAHPGTDWFKAGDLRVALSHGCRQRSDATYLSDYAYHAQMEPLNAVASVSASGDSAEIWTRHPKPDHGAGGDREGARHQPRPGQAQLLPDGRRLRPARPAQLRLHRRCGAAGEGCRQAREGDVDARGRRPERAFPSALGALLCARGSMHRAGLWRGIIGMSAIA